MATELDEVKVQLNSSSFPSQSSTTIDLSPPRDPSSVTVIAFVNFNSGGKMGQQMLNALQRKLGREFVFNLSEGGPKPGLLKYASVNNVRVVACGGDGTINWVLSTIRALGLVNVFSCGIIPLGTGNDTSRCFGWGGAFPGEKGIFKNIDRMKKSPSVLFDRFHLTVKRYDQVSSEFRKQLPAALRPIASESELPNFIPGPAPPPTPEPERDRMGQIVLNDTGDRIDPIDESKAVSMDGAEFNNYLSFGVDAQVMHGFHHARENHRACFPCRLCNMAVVGLCGAKVCCCCQARPLPLQLQVKEADGSWRPVMLPSGTKAIVLQNCLTYAGGKRIWGTSKSDNDEYVGVPASMSDGLFDVVGVYGSIHLAMMMGKLRRGRRICQASEIKITLHGPCYVQLDGEPWDETRSTYHIRRLPQAMMINNTKNSLVK